MLQPQHRLHRNRRSKEYLRIPSQIRRLFPAPTHMAM